MDRHEEFLELCAARTAGELSPDEDARLDAHLAGCPECWQAMAEYEVAATQGMAALAEELAPEVQEGPDSSWSVKRAEEAFFKRLDREERGESDPGRKAGQRFAYRPSQIRWREVWMPLAAAVFRKLTGMAPAA